jgi:tetratricopeptide (TPR) repeat protein
MSKASLRYLAFWVEYLEANQANWRAVQEEFEQITRAWNLLSDDKEILGDSGSRDDLIIRFVDLLQNYLEFRGSWNEGYIPWMEAGLDAARRKGSLEIEFSLLNNLGAGYTDLGNMEKAERHLQEAAALSRKAENVESQISVANNLGVFYFQTGRRQEALQQIEVAYTLGINQKSSKAGHVLNNLGMAFQSMGNLDRALECYEKALQIHQSNQDDAGIAASLNNHGILLAETGNWKNACLYLEQALMLRRQIGDRSREAATLATLGSVNARLTDFKQAISYLEDALSIQQEIGDFPPPQPIDPLEIFIVNSTNGKQVKSI